MARATQHQLRRRAAIIIPVVVVAMAALCVAATATATGARRRVPPLSPPPPPELDYIRVSCTEVHGVSAGETCGSVARDARLTLPSFMELNQNITCGALFPGQWVCVRGVSVGY